MLKLPHVMKVRIPTAALTLPPEENVNQVSVLSYTIVYHWALGCTFWQIFTFQYWSKSMAVMKYHVLIMLNDHITLVNGNRIDSQNADL